MDDAIFKNALEEANKKLEQMLLEQADMDGRQLQLDKDIAKWTEKTIHLAALCDDDETTERAAKAVQESGLTSAVLQVLKASSERALSVVAIRDGITQLGFDVSEYKNILATLHITLKRLHERGEVTAPSFVFKKTGKKLYRWNPRPRAGSELSKAVIGAAAPFLTTQQKVLKEVAETSGLRYNVVPRSPAKSRKRRHRTHTGPKIGDVLKEALIPGKKD